MPTIQELADEVANRLRRLRELGNKPDFRKVTAEVLKKYVLDPYIRSYYVEIGAALGERPRHHTPKRNK